MLSWIFITISSVIGLVFAYLALGVITKFLWLFFPSIISLVIGGICFVFVKGFLGTAFLFVGMCTCLAIYDNWRESETYAKGEEFLKEVFK